MKEIFKKLNKYEIKIRKAVNSHFYGTFRSIFKGTGLEFSDLRTYQYGDDIRAIDWVASSKGQGIYVKIFKEEKEQTVFFMLDVSGSQEVGCVDNDKLQVAKEVCGVLTLSAIKEESQVGLYCFSDQKELYLAPKPGMNQAYLIISRIFKLVPESFKTNLADAISFTLNILKRKSVVILISDFIDDDYEHNLKALAGKHDLVVLHIYDTREIALPNLGIIPTLNKETGKTNWVNTGTRSFKSTLKNRFEERSRNIKRFCNQNNVKYLAIESNADYVADLIHLFRIKR